MIRALIAVAIAVAVHLLLALGLAAILAGRPESSPELPALDLSAVDLSLSERDVEAAPPRPALPPPAPPSAPEPKPAVKRPDLPPLPPPLPLPPLMAAIVIADDPEDPPPELDLPQEADREPEPLTEPESPADPAPPAEIAPAASPAAPAPDQARIVAPPELKTKLDLRKSYPREARLRHEEGDVLLELAIADDGSVAAVTVVGSSGYASLDTAAVKAMKSARFRPARAESGPVATTVRQTLSYRLR